MNAKFIKESFFSISPQELFEFHERKDAFTLLTPASHNIEVLNTASTLRPSDDIVRFVASFLFLKFRFEMIHTVYEPYTLFVDEQQKGLFSSWRHEHRFIPGGWAGDPSVLMRDQIDYSHPLVLALRPFVNHRLEGLFRFRHTVTGQEIQKSIKADRSIQPGKVVITGATGLIGKRIVAILQEKGFEVVALVRNKDKARKILGKEVSLVLWDFTRPDQKDWQNSLNHALGVIHLAGTPLFQQRWTPAFKREIEESRIRSTRQLVEAIGRATQKPEVFITASALGIYGTDPNREVNEESPVTDDFLARICIHWEQEARQASTAGIRTVQVRIGIVLSADSGALKEMLPLFRVGLGGVMGYSDHWINWIHIEDIARIFIMALLNKDMQGPFNAAAPQPVKMEDFAKTLARVLNRPCFFRFPVPLVKIAIGEAGEYTSGGPRAKVDRLGAEDYQFFFAALEPALRNILRRY